MAAALFNKFVNPEKAKALSAGTEPSERVHPEVLIVMKDIGLDLSEMKPTLLTEGLASQADLLVTMGCGEKCPYVPGLKTLDWPLPDPKGQELHQVRKIREKIQSLVWGLIKENQWG